MIEFAQIKAASLQWHSKRLDRILTGKPAYWGANTDSVRLMAIRGDTAEAFARLDASGADAELVALAKRCLAREHEERPRDAGEVARAVSAHLAAAEERARQAELDRVRAAEERKRQRVLLAMVGLTMLLVLMGMFGFGMTFLWKTAQRSQSEAENARDQLDDEKTQTEAARDEALRLKGIAETAQAGEAQARKAAEQARDLLKGEKKQTEAARDEALRLKGIAETAQASEAQARKAVERERKKLEVFEYGRTMQVALQEWRDNNVAAAVALLEGTNPELRGWEWHYVHRLCHGALLTLKGHTSSVSSASFSADGTRIVTGSYDHTAKVWDAKTGAERLTLKGHTSVVGSASFSTDGTRIVTGSEDKTAKVWDAKTGAELLTLKGHTGGVRPASFSTDGTRIVTGSYSTAKVWDARTGAELLTLKGHTGGVLSASFSTDGTRIVTGSGDRTAKVWDSRPVSREFLPKEQAPPPREVSWPSGSR